MGDLPELLRAVLANPDDPAPRLVYADALLDAGDPRGELIAVEHQLEGAPAPALLGRRRELRRLHGSDFWPELPVRFVRSRLGFAEAIAFRPEELERATALAAREPVRAVEVYGGALESRALSALPSVRELVLHQATDQTVAALLEAPLARTLAALDVSGSDVGSFVPRGRLPACRRLGIAATQIEVDDLLGWGHLARVRELDVSGTNTYPQELAALLRAAPELEVLRASSLPLDLDDGGERLTVLAEAFSASPRLKRAELVGCSGLSRKSAAAIQEAAPRLVIDTGSERAQVLVDLVGWDLELAPVGDRAWTVRVDRVHRPVRCDLTQSDSIGSSTRSGPEEEAAALDLLRTAIAGGFPRQLTVTGFHLLARMHPRDNNVEAWVKVPDEPGPVLIELEHYVD